MYEDEPLERTPPPVRPEGEGSWVLAGLGAVFVASMLLLVALYSRAPLPWIAAALVWAFGGVAAMVVARRRRRLAQPPPRAERAERAEVSWPRRDG